MRERKKHKKKRKSCTDFTSFTSVELIVLFSLNQIFPLHFCSGKAGKFFFSKNVFLEEILTPL